MSWCACVSQDACVVCVLHVFSLLDEILCLLCTIPGLVQDMYLSGSSAPALYQHSLRVDICGVCILRRFYKWHCDKSFDQKKHSQKSKAEGRAEFVMHWWSA